jgi:uncharacterized protein YybS (DUF2232 family)
MLPFELTIMDEQFEPLLKEEYFHLQKVVEEFDSKALTIKTWSVSGSLVVISAGLSKDRPNELFLIGAIAAMLFWIIEAYWKAFQLSNYARIMAIEAYFRSPRESTIKPLQIASAWSRSYRDYHKKKIFEIIWWPAVMLPHIVLFLGGIALYYLSSIIDLDLWNL